jgi:hypothetical protein
LANAKSKRARGLTLLLAGLALVLAALWFSAPGTQLRGDAVAGVAYAARVACSCRYVAGRSLADCRKDKLAGMEMLTLSEDAATRSVTASVPLIARDTARFREGSGCVLDAWRSRER